MAEWLEPHGFSPTQYNALRILRGAGVDGLPCTEVGGAHDQSRSGYYAAGGPVGEARVSNAQPGDGGSAGGSGQYYDSRFGIASQTRPAGECVCTREDGTFADGEIAGVDAFVGRGGIAGVAMSQWLTPRRSGGGGVKVRSEKCRCAWGCRRGTKVLRVRWLRLTPLRRTVFRVRWLGWRDDIFGGCGGWVECTRLNVFVPVRSNSFCLGYRRDLRRLGIAVARTFFFATRVGF